MNRWSLSVPLLLFASTLFAQSKPAPLAWKKTVLDSKFRSEGVAIADVNRDGKPDIVVGEVWYEAPDWKMHVIRKDKDFRDGDKNVYSQSFAVFAEDLDGDGYPDAIVVGFPGAPCHWYKNPGKTGEKWLEYVIQENACNETPIYSDLLVPGKRALVLGHRGEMCFFVPDSDPTKPWVRTSVSGKNADPKKEMPGTNKFSHGLGVGDVDGDGFHDVLCGKGWWQNPGKASRDGPWKFHPLDIPNCADIYAFDVDGDGKNDLISTSAHNTGFWWHQQRPGKDSPTFITNKFFSTPAELAKLPGDAKFTKEEADLYQTINKARLDQKKAPWLISKDLCEIAKSGPESKKFQGKIVGAYAGPREGFSEALKSWVAKERSVGLEVGVASRDQGQISAVLGDRGAFALPGQTHALHFVDIDGDGVKDLVTGRRHWAHGPNGDDHPADPAYLFWFKGAKDSTGLTSFAPYMIDDDSGVGTQFAIGDLDGDGKPDIAVANKKGVFIFIQSAVSSTPPPPARKD